MKHPGNPAAGSNGHVKQELIELTKRYVVALRAHLKQRPGSNLPGELAGQLGRQAAALGLETLDLARDARASTCRAAIIHQKNSLIKRAGIFFAEANRPMEETHQAARQNKVHLHRLKKALGQRTEELAVSNRQLQRGAARRKIMEEAFAKSGERHDRSLEESLSLQSRLRQLTHRVLATQEDDRQKISHELQDEIAQTLLGINIRLLSLKHGDRSHTKGLKAEIASAQRLVVASARSVRRFARELDSHPKAPRDPSTRYSGTTAPHSPLLRALPT